MDRARFDRVQELFHACADLSEPERRAYLSESCGADRELIAEVESLIEGEAKGSFLDRGVAAAAALATSPAPAALVGRRFGPYRLERLLGEGGAGVVYLGRRDDLDSVAAIKILRDAGLSPARLERFRAEQRTLARLDHPSIARLYDADTLEDGTPWFAMEYVDGVPLNRYAELRGCTVAERLRLFREVCEAVRQAHLRAVIHRDLKPSNILATPDGVKLLDFGIAKQLDRFDAPPNPTLTALRMMTPAYAAPEQLRGEPAGVYTDVYALGVILYELLAGRRPFDLSDCSAGEAERRILAEEPEKPSAAAARSLAGRRAGASSWADLDVLCLTAMHKAPERRYQSVEALIRDVDHYLGGEPLEARPDSFGYRLGKFVRRHRGALSAVAAIAVLIVGLTVYYTARLASARNAAQAEAARTQRIMGFLLNLFEGGDREAGPANDLRVVTLVDRGVEEARGLDRDPEAQADLYRTLGNVSQKLGNLDRAATLLQSAMDQRRRLFGSAHPLLAESLTDLALLRTEQARFDEAERLAREGLEMARRTHPARHPSIASATEALGRVLSDRGAYGQAVPTLEEAVRLRTDNNAAPNDLASALFELANAHFYAGHYAESEKLNQRVLTLYREIHGPRHPLVAEALINLGAIQHDTGHYREAEQFHRQALKIVADFYGQEHAKNASSLTMVARAVLFLKRYDEAVGLLNRSLEIRERVYGPEHPQVASTLNELGNAAIGQGRFAEAALRFERIVGIYRKAYNGRHYLIGIGLSNLASAYLNGKEFARAEELFREALAMYGQTLPAGHQYVGIARIKLGRALLRQKRFSEAERETRSGYEILAKQSNPAVSFLQAARQDLAEAYVALRRPEEAQKFRAEREAVALQGK